MDLYIYLNQLDDLLLVGLLAYLVLSRASLVSQSSNTVQA